MRNVGQTPQKSTPQKKVEPTNEIYRKGGHKTPAEALSTDKGSVRKPVDKG